MPVLIYNKLSLHLGKTESILFGSKPKLRPKSNISIECKAVVIEPQDKMKCLGAVLDHYLMGERKTNLVLQKANARLSFDTVNSFLTLSTLGKIFSRRHFEIFFLFFSENRI